MARLSTDSPTDFPNLPSPTSHLPLGTIGMIPSQPDEDKIQERLDGLTARYAAGGLPWTVQRRALIDALARRFDHPTVDQIFSDVARTLPEVSRTTVYRSLEVFNDLNLLRRIEHPGSAVRYDVNLSQHHHFLCTKCESLADISPQEFQGLDQVRYLNSDNEEEEELTLFVRGVCAACR